MAARYVFLCDASPEAGFGHFSRCFNIACGLTALRPDVDILFCGKLSGAAVQRLDAIGASANTTVDESRLAGRTVVLDRYDITQDDIDRLTAVAGALVKVDDFNEYDLGQAAAVVNFRAGAEDWTYAAKHAFLGLAHYPAHPDFAIVRRQKLEVPIARGIDARSRAMNVLVSIGGTDRHGVAGRVIEALDRLLRNARITWLMAGPSDMRPKELRHNELIIGAFTGNMAERYAGTDAVISGGGVTKYEAGFCMVPNGCISQTPEQQQDTEIMAAMNLTYDIGRGTRIAHDGSDLDERIEAFLSRQQLDQQLTALAVRYDVGSLSRLADGILNLL
jgi:spore coat polysaccharide biosynthesis predicted glycosyltransferase SpsG